MKRFLDSLTGRAPVAIAAIAVAAALIPAAASADRVAGGSWLMGGHDYAGTRWNPLEIAIGPGNAGTLAPKWTFTTHGDVSATPLVGGGSGASVVFPDWGGFLDKVDAATGKQIWSRPISDYDGISGSLSRTSPASSADGSTIYIGDQNGAHLIALDAATGDPIWSTQLDSHPTAVLTQSPIVLNGVVYEGVSSLEEDAATNPNYPCCTFRGSMTATDAATGRLLWKTFTIPDNGGATGGYSGGAVWGGPALDPTQGLLFVDTGNNYTVPKSVTDCQSAGNPPSVCLSPDDHVDSMLALDMQTGTIRWASGARIFDAWNLSCVPGFPPNNCPPNAGPDYDFGSGPNLFAITDSAGHTREAVGAGQKSGQYWALDAATGSVVWSASVGPGGPLGGIEWGTATDLTRIYVAEADSLRTPYTLPNGTTIDSGSFAALDVNTGKLLWQVADPSDNADRGAVTTANGVVYAGSMSGHMYALDATSGATLFDFTGQGSSNAGPAVVNGTVYWGNGYDRFPPPFNGTPSTTFYAFSPLGR